MSDTINTGGPAFPNPALASEAFMAPYDMSGMTLRDWFAGQALAGLCNGFTGTSGDSEWFEQVGAAAAYRIADALLAARNEGAQ